MENSAKADSVRILTIGIDDNLLAELNVDTEHLAQSSLPADLDAILAAETVPCKAVFVRSDDISFLKESAQLLRSIYQEATLVGLVNQRRSFQREDLRKNGFSEVYLLPFDNESFRQDLNSFVSASANYKRVRLNDLQSDTVLSFDTFIYMPHSKKYVAYSKSGSPIEPDRLTNLKDHSAGSLAVRDTEMQKLYTYFSEQSEAGQSGAISETQKAERTSRATRALLRSILVPAGEAEKFESGRELLEDALRLVADLRSIIPAGTVYGMVQSCLEWEDGQSGHAQKVVCVADIIATKLGVQKLDDLRIAAFFHDLGMADIPLAISNRAISELNGEDKKRLESHREVSVRILKDKRISVSEHATKLIMQQHERYDGTGYPNQMHTEGFHADAQILAMADELVDRTRSDRPEKVEMLDDVLESWKIDSIKTQKNQYQPELLQKVLELFLGKKP